MVEWVAALRSTGSVAWYRGVAAAQAALALTDGTEVAVQSTPYVAPGQVGWFIARFRAPASPGTHSVALFPRIDGRGELPDLGIYNTGHGASARSPTGFSLATRAGRRPFRHPQRTRPNRDARVPGRVR